MNKRILFLLGGFIALFLVYELGVKGVERSETRTIADVVYLNGKVWTGVEGASNVQAIATRGDKIIGVGSSTQIMALKGLNTQVIDLGDKLVIPGFIDNHTHFINTGFNLASVKLRDAATQKDFAKRIRDFAKTLEPGTWILGGEWDHELWGGELPKAEWIDALTPNNPVFVTRLDGHMSLANSLVIALSGVTTDDEDPLGGYIARDEEGAPAGVFKDTAQDAIFKIMPKTSDQENTRAIKAATDLALSNGVTQIHDVNLWSDLEAFKKVNDAKDLNLRVYSFVPLASWERLRDYVSVNGMSNGMHRWGGLKGMVDGSLGSTTAWFYDPYNDEPETSGFPLAGLDIMAQNIIGANKAGLHLAVHAIGDKANDWLLDRFQDAIKTNGAGDHRFRIEHAQHITNDAFGRFKELGVIPSMQPYHAIDDGRWAEKRIGEDRIKTTYAFRSFLDAGAMLTFGSDTPVAAMTPLVGIYAAVTRQTIDGANPEGWIPKENITVKEALKAYTSSNAYAGFQENELGTLEVGKLADFVILGEDIFTILPSAIENVNVLKTIIGGKLRYERK